MTLIVEDGTGLTDSETYASVAVLRAYAAKRGVALPDDDTECEALLIKAMDFLQDQDFLGRKTSPSQSLPWPRTGVCIEELPVPSNELPRQLIFCQCAAAIEAASIDLLPTQDVSTPGQILEETVGPITTVYANNNVVRRVPAMAKVDTLLRCLIRKNGLFVIRC